VQEEHDWVKVVNEALPDEDIIIEQDLGSLEEELSDDGYEFISDKIIYEEGELQLC